MFYLIFSNCLYILSISSHTSESIFFVYLFILLTFYLSFLYASWLHLFIYIFVSHLLCILWCFFSSIFYLFFHILHIFIFLLPTFNHQYLSVLCIRIPIALPVQSIHLHLINSLTCIYQSLRLTYSLTYLAYSSYLLIRHYFLTSFTRGQGRWVGQVRYR